MTPEAQLEARARRLSQYILYAKLNFLAECTVTVAVPLLCTVEYFHAARTPTRADGSPGCIRYTPLS